MTKNRTTEAEISEAVLQILAETHHGEATLGYLRKRIPDKIKLMEGDRAQSLTRANEELWEQLLRNIVSHKKTQGNYIAEGYLAAPSRGRLVITDTGRRRIS